MKLIVYLLLLSLSVSLIGFHVGYIFGLTEARLIVFFSPIITDNQATSLVREIK